MEPSGSVKNGGSGKLSAMDGKRGIDSVGCAAVERPAGGLEIVGFGALEIVGSGGLERVASGKLDWSRSGMSN